MVENFTHNKIFIFPQTIYYANTREGRELMENSARLYMGHPHLVITLREQESYKLAKDSMRIPEEKLFLSPDMAFYLQNQKKPDNQGEGILFCIRQDKESLINSDHLEKVVAKLKDKYEITFTDTQVPRAVSLKNERRELNEKLKEFAQAKVVVTDKLHGIIMAILSGTPVIILDSKTHKVCNVWQSWLKTCQSAAFAEQPTEIPEKIEKILAKNRDVSLKVDFSNQFAQLAKEIKTKTGPF